MSDTRVIAIETSSRRGSVALGAGPRLVAAYEFSADQQHAVELLPTIARACDAAGWERATIGAVLVSIGPGSFTGLRVAVTAARHLALALGARVVAVPSLAVIADNARLARDPPPRVAVILDAKRRQVYAQEFARGADGWSACGEPELVDAAEFLGRCAPGVSVTGEGVGYHRAAVAAAGVAVLDEALHLPRAESVHRLGWALLARGATTPAGALTPQYIRRPEAEELWERRHGAASA
ncbi:MAG: tRNA (adenosine(37)-N6)-threonylcarbamoyltransferase complex dimerization subunit type 1 TsaB [Phycisphaerae bacterium]